MDVSTAALRAFLTLAEQKHFGRAAEQLHVTSPALSQMIRRLETELGFPLFTRTTRSVTLTEAGEGLTPYASQVVEAVLNLERWRRTRVHHERFTLQFGFTVNGAGALMSAILTRARSDLPEVKLTTRQVHWPDLHRVIQDGTVDIAIFRGPRDFPGLSVTPVFEEDWVVAVPTGHPLAELSQVDLRQVRGERIIRPDIGPLAGPRPMWLGGEQPDGYMPPAGPYAQSLEEALDHVEMGEGFLITGESVPALYPRTGVVYVPATGLPPGYIGLVSRRDRHNPLVTAFERLVIEVANEVRSHRGI